MYKELKNDKIKIVLNDQKYNLYSTYYNYNDVSKTIPFNKFFELITSVRVDEFKIYVTYILPSNVFREQNPPKILEYSSSHEKILVFPRNEPAAYRENKIFEELTGGVFEN